MMKIALLSYEYPVETGFGGIGTYTWYQARALARLGHEVHVLAGARAPTDLRREDHDGVRVHRFNTATPLLRFFGMDRRKLWWTKNRLENAYSMYKGLRLLVEKHKFDIVEMPECGGEGLLINYLMRVPTLVKFHSPAKLIMPYYDVRKADHTLCSIVEQLALRAATAYSSCSQFLADEVRTRMGIGRDVHVIANGIDLELFDTSEQVNARDEFGIPHGKPMIFFAGRMEKRKGIHLCKEIVASILQRHDVAVVFAGQDLFHFVERELIPSLAGMQLRGSFHYVGKLDLTGVRSCLRQADIFLIPSVWENCPYSCLEAMAAGRAIVSSDAGGLPELLEQGKTGLFAPTGDAEAFIARLDELIGDPALRQRLGAAARRRIEEHYTDAHIARLSTQAYSRYAGGAR